MNIIKKKQFKEVEFYEFGFGPLGPPMMTVHMFLIDGILIDTAQSNMRKFVTANLENKKINKILLTHHHEDHSGNAFAISRISGARVIGHPIAAQKLKTSYSIFPYQHLIWGKTKPVVVAPLPKVIESDRFCLTPIHTPGHSKDHTVYLEKREGWLFSGDLFLGERIKYFRADEVFSDQINSLKKILSFDFEVLFCAHNPCLSKGKEKMKNKLEFLENFYGEIKFSAEKGDSETAIIKRMKSREVKMIKFLCMGNVSFANMVRSAYKALP